MKRTTTFPQLGKLLSHVEHWSWLYCQVMLQKFCITFKAAEHFSVLALMNLVSNWNWEDQWLNSWRKKLLHRSAYTQNSISSLRTIAKSVEDLILGLQRQSVQLQRIVSSHITIICSDGFKPTSFTESFETLGSQIGSWWVCRLLRKLITLLLLH